MLHVDVTVVTPAAQVVHGTTVVVRKGVVGIERVLSGATGVLLGDEEEVVRWMTAVLLGTISVELDVTLIVGRIVVTGIVIVTIAVETVVFMLWLQLVVSVPPVVKVLQTVQGAVIVVVNTVVVVPKVVIVEDIVFVGAEVPTTVKVEP